MRPLSGRLRRLRSAFRPPPAFRDWNSCCTTPFHSPMPGSQPEALTAQDRVDIAELVASYARCLDTADIDGYVKLFAPEGVLDGQAGPRSGHDAIRKVAEAMAQVAAQ